MARSKNYVSVGGGDHPETFLSPRVAVRKATSHAPWPSLGTVVGVLRAMIDSLLLFLRLLSPSSPVRQQSEPHGTKKQIHLTKAE